MASCLRSEGAAAYRVLEIDPGDGTEKWLAVQFIPEPVVGFGGTMGEAVLLYAISPDKRIFAQWNQLPPWFDSAFEKPLERDLATLPGVFQSAVDHLPSRFSPHKLTQKLLIDDFDLGNISAFSRWPQREPNANMGENQLPIAE